MRIPGIISAVSGLLCGILAVALVPDAHLFVAHDAHGDDATGERWACPMMCVILGRAGTCPVCGMTLEHMTAGELNREQQRRMGLRTVVVTEGTAVTTLRASGLAEYDERHSKVVIPRVAGRITARHQATFGCCTVVGANEPIVDLYSPEVFRAQGELSAALTAGDAALAKAIEERFARWNLSAYAADIRAGKPPVDIVTIRSPWGGQVYLEDQDMVNRILMVGAEVAADMPLIKLVDPQRMTLVVQVHEPLGRWLREGQKVDLATDDAGELPEVKAEVGRVANEISPTLRAREVLIHLEDARKRISPGSLVTARIRAALAADLMPADTLKPETFGRFAQVPKTAVLSTGVRHIAWKVAERRADGSLKLEPAPLVLGPRLEGDDGSDRYVVRQGLKPGDEVVERALFLVDAQAQLAGSPSLLQPDGVGHAR